MQAAGWLGGRAAWTGAEQPTCPSSGQELWRSAESSAKGQPPPRPPTRPFTLPQICGEVVAEGPEDDVVLSTLTYTYKAVGRPGDITAAYVAATERNPGNVEVLTGLFAAYARWARSGWGGGGGMLGAESAGRGCGEAWGACRELPGHTSTCYPCCAVALPPGSSTL